MNLENSKWKLKSLLKIQCATLCIVYDLALNLTVQMFCCLPFDSKQVWNMSPKNKRFKHHRIELSLD